LASAFVSSGRKKKGNENKFNKLFLADFLASCFFEGWELAHILDPRECLTAVNLLGPVIFNLSIKLSLLTLNEGKFRRQESINYISTNRLVPKSLARYVFFFPFSKKFHFEKGKKKKSTDFSSSCVDLSVGNKLPNSVRMDVARWGPRRQK